jgi:hypothetical protein
MKKNLFLILSCIKMKHQHKILRICVFYFFEESIKFVIVVCFNTFYLRFIHIIHQVKVNTNNIRRSLMYEITSNKNIFFCLHILYNML